jgi:SAM-dependent methyltransferase
MSAVIDLPCACGATRYVRIYDGVYSRGEPASYAFALLRCRECGLTRSSPLPDQNMYQALDFVDGNGTPSPRSRPWLSVAVDSIQRELEAAGFNLQGPILDVGCNTGELVEALINRGYDAEGCDVDEPAVQVGRSRELPVFTLNLEREPLTKRYSAAVCIHTLEHTLAPAELLNRLASGLMPGAPLYVAVPNYGGLVPRLMRESWGFLVPMQHVWHFTPKTLRATLERSGRFLLVRSSQRVHLEPAGVGAKGAAKRAVLQLARLANRSDEIRAVFRRVT